MCPHPRGQYEACRSNRNHCLVECVKIDHASVGSARRKGVKACLKALCTRRVHRQTLEANVGARFSLYARKVK
jgi:hypothetical protein